MLEFQQKRKIRKIIYSPVSLILLAIIAVFFVRGAWNVYQKESSSQDYLNQAQDELSKVTTTQQGLSESVAELQTEQGVEADIRHKFRVVKPGEQIAVIVDDSASSTASTTAAASSIWQKVIGFFGL